MDLLPLEEPLQDAGKEAFHKLGDSSHAVRNARHGTWLHEPLHSVITDVPVGSFTAVVVFDALAAMGTSERMNTAADASILLGLAGSVAAAVTGMNDWAEVKKHAPRRIGAVHGLLNLGMVALFGASRIARRRRGSRSKARGLAAAGYAVLAASAHLGGNLVYGHGIGVKDSKPLG